MNGEDFKILCDETVEGVRHIEAEPSSLVCSIHISFDIKEGKLHNVKYTKGCDGNLQAIGRLLEGMDARQAATILNGVNCHQRGTSCSDQLSRIIAKCLVG